MTTPKVSIIVPVYNAEKYLSECLDAIFNQSLKDIEVIIVNDGSTDTSWQIVQEYTKKHKNSIALNQKNMGVKKARINGYKQARGKYIAWVDNDDIVSKNMLEQMYVEAEKDDSDIVICDYNFYPKSVSTKQKWFKEYEGMVDWHFVSHNTLLWNKLFRREFIDNISFATLMGRLGEASFLLPLLLAESISTINTPLYSYRVGQGGQSSMSNMRWYKENYELSREREVVLRELNLHSQWEDYARYLTSFSLVQLLIVSAFNNNRLEYRQYRRKIHDTKGLKNKLFKKVIIEEYGLLKYIAFRYIAPYSFLATKIAARKVA